MTDPSQRAADAAVAPERAGRQASAAASTSASASATASASPSPSPPVSTPTVDTERTVEVGAGHPSFAGHFPGDPLWPGVLLLAEAMEAIAAEPALAAAVGAAPRLAVAKFLSPVRPGTRLAVHAVRAAAGVDFRIVDADDASRLCAEGRFALADAARPSP